MTANYCSDCGKDLTGVDTPVYCPQCGEKTGAGGDVTYNDPGEDHRSPEQKLKALIKKDLDPDITATAKRALKRRQQMKDEDNE